MCVMDRSSRSPQQTGEGAMAVQLIHGHLAVPSPRRVGWAAAPRGAHRSPALIISLANLADRDLELLAELANPVDVPCDQLIIEEGREGDTLYLVLDGQLEVFTNRDGRDVRLTLLTRGQIVGEMAVLQQSPRTGLCPSGL